MRLSVLLLVGCALTVPAAGRAAAIDQTADEGASRVVGELAACRSIAEPTQRLACFDRTSAALVAARDNKTIVVVDRAEVRKVNRSLFGFALPNLNLFGKGDTTDEPPIPEITGKIVKTGVIGRDLFSMTLEDGTVWRMSESLGRYPPNIGDKVRIVRGALGSFRATIAGGPFIQVNRIR